MTIDLALGSMFKTIDSNESGGKIIKWIIAKFIWFGLLLYLMEKWGTIFGNTAKEFFENPQKDRTKEGFLKIRTYGRQS